MGSLYVVWFCWEKAFLALAMALRLGGVAVISESPLWKDRIEQQWRPRLPRSFVVLNWSTRRGDRSGKWLAWRLHTLFIGRNREYCPVVIVLRGWRYPVIFRFFSAFKEHAQGRSEALEVLEEKLFHVLATTA